MEIVENKIYYHIQRKVSWNQYSFWEKDKTYFVGKDKNPFFKTFDYAYPNPESIANHYMKLVRELTFEEIRLEFFPTFPSRTRCLWVLTEDQETLKYWWNELKIDGCKQLLLKLKLTGKIYQTNQHYLDINKTFSLDELKQKAFQYWLGASNSDLFDNEILFEGFAQVVDIYNSSNL